MPYRDLKNPGELAPPLPASMQAETAILGCLLMNNAKLDEAASLAPSDFFYDSHKRIFSTMREMANACRPFDLVTLADELFRSGDLEKVGGGAYLASLSDHALRNDNVAHYASIVKNRAVLRQLIHASESAKEIAMSGEASPEELIENLLQQIGDLALSVTTDAEGKTYETAAISFLESASNPTPVRVYSDIAELDRLVGGFQVGELVTIVAPTGVGKTLLAQQVRRRACRDGLHTLYCSAEMTAEHLISRELAAQAGVAPGKMRVPQMLSKDEMRSLMNAAGHECKTCRILDGELSLHRIRIAARRMKARGRLDAVILDYDELISAPGDDDLAQQAFLVRSAKALAMELKICVIVISQLRKALNPEESKRPTIQRIYGSGAKSKHSSIVIFVRRQYVENLQGDETEAEIIVLKNRDGRVGTIPARFNVRTLRFEDAAKDAA